eukprot:3292373-Pyramimonas_sp.AAC.1
MVLHPPISSVLLSGCLISPLSCHSCLSFSICTLPPAWARGEHAAAGRGRQEETGRATTATKRLFKGGSVHKEREWRWWRRRRR